MENPFNFFAAKNETPEVPAIAATPADTAQIVEAGAPAESLEVARPVQSEQSPSVSGEVQDNGTSPDVVSEPGPRATLTQDEYRKYCAEQRIPFEE